MPKKRTHERVSISLPISLVERISKHRSKVNTSAICAAALDAFIRSLEVEEVEKQWSRHAELVVEASPETAGRYIEAGEDMPLPMPLATELPDLLPHERDAAIRAWRGGTVSAWEKLSHKPLPFKYPE